jgi:hypothetical protein
MMPQASTVHALNGPPSRFMDAAQSSVVNARFSPCYKEKKSLFSPLKKEKIESHE